MKAIDLCNTEILDLGRPLSFSEIWDKPGVYRLSRKSPSPIMIVTRGGRYVYVDPRTVKNFEKVMMPERCSFFPVIVEIPYEVEIEVEKK